LIARYRLDVRYFTAIVKNQFPKLTIVETGQEFSNVTSDQEVAIGTLEKGGAFSIQIEGGKRNGSGLQIDITGAEGDLKISNRQAFGSKEVGFYRFRRNIGSSRRPHWM